MFWQLKLLEKGLDPARQCGKIADSALLQELPESEESVGVERERPPVILLLREPAKVNADPILEPGASASLNTP
jgi:hypothetical protein